MAKEPIPTAEYLVPLNHYFLSAGKSIIYQVVSGVMCRIYWQRYDDSDLSDSARNYMNWVITPDLELEAITPWKTESAWYPYTKKDGSEGWKRDGANFPSYQVRIVYCFDNTVMYGKITDITIRHKPIQAAELSTLFEIQKMACSHYQNTPIRPSLLSQEFEPQIRRMEYGKY